MHAWLDDPTFWRVVAILCGIFVAAMAIRGVIVRLREMPRHKLKIRLKVGSRVLYYDPDDPGRSEAQISQAIQEGSSDGAATR
jgi:hypothetical protein